MLARRSIAALLTLASLAAAGCSSDDGEDSGGTITEMVARVPSDAVEEEGAWIVVSDLDAASELGGIDRPAADADDETFRDWLAPVSGIGDDAVTAVQLPQLFQQIGAEGLDGMRDQFGWTINDISRFVEVRFQRSFLIADADDLTADDLAAALTPTEDDDEIFTTSDEGGGDSSAIFSTIDDGELAVASSENEISAWRDDPKTLADDEDVLALARSLDDHDAYAAVLVPDAFGPIDGDEPTVGAFDSLALGLTVEEDRAVAIIVYRYPSADDADTAVGSTEALLTDERLADVFGDIEVESDGDNVVVTANLVAQPNTFWSLLSRFDPILVSS